MILTLSIIGCILLVVEAYVIFNLMRKMESFEDYRDELEQSVTKVIQRMKEIDDKQIFEKDDEVGAVFEDLKNTVYLLESHSTIKISNETKDQS